MKSLLVVIFGAAAIGGGCSSDSPVDVAGDYMMNIVNKDNGCMLGNGGWDGGTSKADVVVTQDGSHATIQINGAAGIVVTAALGSSTWDASVDGAHLDAVQHGTVQQVPKGNCTYFLTAEISAGLTTDTLDGQIKYTAETNHGTDCDYLETCSSFQDINGLRPPT